MTVLPVLSPVPRAAQAPPRLRRRECFFGLHFDMHARPWERGIGRRTTAAMLERLIRKVRPDYIQCDCKGHPGISSYPTRVGHAAEGMIGDPLRIWRQVTAKHGIGLFMHYSGVLDAEAVRRRPDWARLDADGAAEPGTEERRATSVFGRYADELLIPQLKELCDLYEVDGAWVDGECWGCEPDYHPEVLAAFREATGIDTVPKAPGDPGWFEFQQFCREGFRVYLRRYINILHAHRPSFQITSNWAFSSLMPEPVTAAVDFLSGDFSPQNSVESARWEGRFLASQGMPWDLMAWGFTERLGEGCPSAKSPAQIKREAAVVFALGGGFQVYFKQRRDGSIFEEQIKTMREVAKFCRARQAFCHRSEPVPQIALAFSTEDFYRRCRRLFGAWAGEFDGSRGVLRMLLDAQQVVDVHADHTLIPRLAEYPLVVLPETEYLAPALREALCSYVHKGGNLLLVGPRAARLFAGELGIEFSGEPAVRSRWINVGGQAVGQKTLSQDVRPGPHAEVFGRLSETAEPSPDGPPAATLHRVGSGMIGAVYVNLGERYNTGQTFLAREFLRRLVRRLMPHPLAEVTGSPYVDVTVQRLGDALYVHLVNTSGPHDDPDVYVFDHIEPVGPLQIALRIPRPARITLRPGGRQLRFAWENGVARLRLSRLPIHAALAVEFA